MVTPLSEDAASGVPCAPYRPDGPYPLLINSEPVLQWRGVTLKEGIPLQTNEEGRHYRSVDEIATYGLQAWRSWRTSHSAEAMRTMVHVARWLVAHQPKDGGWRYPFSYSMASVGISVTLPVGWVAAQAQGDSIALLMRAYQATRNPRFLASARRAVKPYERGVKSHGIHTVFRKHVFFDGFPSSPPSLILEDFDLSLLGLDDVAPYDKAAGKLFREGLKSLYWALPLIDDGTGKPLYGLTYLTYPGAPRIYEQASHTLQAQIVCELSRAYPNHEASVYAARWMASNPYVYYR